MKNTLFLFPLVICISCISTTDKRLEDTLTFAGSNRAELEKVLHHYKDNPQKQEAARFLLIHMKDRHHYRSAGIDSIRHYLTVATQQESCLPFDVEQKWGAYHYKQEKPIYDVQVLTAEYLIENIDLAFEAWQYRDWGKHYSFDDFCHYLLPYWIGDEAPDNWRRTFAARYRPVLDSLYQGTDVVVAVDSLQHYLQRTYPFCYNNDFQFPHLGGEFLLQHAVGACREETDFMIYLLRTLGIPVASDRYIYSPDAFLGHSWSVFKDTTGSFIPTELLRTGVSREWNNRRRKGKVYREQTIPQKNCGSLFGYKLTDVTTDYYPTNRVVIPTLQRKGKEKEGLVGVFSMNGWVPVGKYAWQNNQAVIENIEVGGLIYQPLRMNGNRWIPSGYPFLTDEEGRATSLIPDTIHTETVTLTRKHPLTQYWVDIMHDMDGVRIYGSNDKNFRNPTLLGEPVCDSLYRRKKHIAPQSKEAFRYLKISPPKGKRLNISELVVYESGDEEKRVDCKVVSASPALGGVTDYSIDKAFDGENLSRYESAEADTDCIIELEHPARISRILYVSRNDDNYVTSGDTYELFYQDGEKGWKSLGIQTATQEQLIYKDVPRGALLWLHNHTKGVEEQVFRWVDGEQMFCYKVPVNEGI